MSTEHVARQLDEQLQLEESHDEKLAFHASLTCTLDRKEKHPLKIQPVVFCSTQLTVSILDSEQQETTSVRAPEQHPKGSVHTS